jgi:DNA modification methylase
MIEGINKVHHMNFLDNILPDRCANLIIADPPYFEVKGDFDFIWKSFDEYLKDVEKWAIECKRLLADNGTLFWYGHAKNIAYSQIIFDKYFNLINNLVWDKGSFMGLEESEGLRSFAPCTERFLMYGSKAQDTTGLDYVKVEFVRPNNPISIYMKKEMKTHNITQKQIAKLFPSVTGGLTGCVHNWLNGDGRAITKEHYEKIQLNFDYAFKKPYEELKKEYEELRKEYEKLRRPFTNYFKLQEILKFSNEAVKTGAKYDHDTVKPETLTRALIMTCSRKNDLVVVPFAGSGTECAMAAKENRNFWACDIEKKYVEMSNNRCREHLQTQSLF